MTDPGDDRGPRPGERRWERLKNGFAGRGVPERAGAIPGSRWHGGFRRRRKILGLALAAVVLLGVVGTLLGVRAISSGDLSSSDGRLGQSQQQLANSQGAVQEANSSGVPEATDAGNAATGQGDTEPPDTSGMEKLGEFETDYRYSDSEARKENLRKSAAAVDGTVLEPGEVFSMNDKLEGLDYNSAKVFADGGESEALGGGLCQVTSTVYMAAQLAGLEIVERNAHYTVLPYIRPGFDATIWFGGQGIPELDMKFKNTTGSDVLVREYITDDGILKAEIWGQPTGKEVEMRSEQDFRDLEKGIKWSTYKTVREDGEIVREGLLHEDLYSFPPPTEGNGEGYNDVRTGGW